MVGAGVCCAYVDDNALVLQATLLINEERAVINIADWILDSDPVFSV